MTYSRGVDDDVDGNTDTMMMTLDQLIRTPINQIPGRALPSSTRTEIVTTASDWPTPVLVINDGGSRNMVATSYRGG